MNLVQYLRERLPYFVSNVSISIISDRILSGEVPFLISKGNPDYYFDLEVIQNPYNSTIYNIRIVLQNNNGEIIQDNVYNINLEDISDYEV